MGNSREIRFLGQKFPLRMHNTDPELADETLALVTQVLERAEGRITARANPIPHQVMLLALLDLAEEYVQARHRSETYRAELRGLVKDLYRLLPASPPESQDFADAPSREPGL